MKKETKNTVKDESLSGTPLEFPHDGLVLTPMASCPEGKCSKTEDKAPKCEGGYAFS